MEDLRFLVIKTWFCGHKLHTICVRKLLKLVAIFGLWVSPGAIWSKIGFFSPCVEGIQRGRNPDFFDRPLWTMHTRRACIVRRTSLGTRQKLWPRRPPSRADFSVFWEIIRTGLPRWFPCGRLKRPHRATGPGFRPGPNFSVFERAVSLNFGRTARHS